MGTPPMNELLEQFFNLDIMREALPYLLKGLLTSLALTLVLTPLGVLLGLGLALASKHRNRLLRSLVRIWVNVFRAIPPPVLIILLFSSLTFMQLNLPALVCLMVALALNSSAYYCEIYRAGLDSVPPGQAEAALATGLNRFQVLVFVVLPQATRTVLPDLISNTIEVVKSTSLAALISVTDLLYAANTVRSVTYNTSPLTLAALLYIVILLPAVRLATRLERRPSG